MPAWAKHKHRVGPVTTHYATQSFHWPVEIAPYIPDVWLEGGKQDPAFRTKIEIALELVDRARAVKLPFRAVVADSWYGRTAAFIKGLDEREVPHVVELDPSQRVYARLSGDIARNEHRLKEALSLLSVEDFRPVDIKNADRVRRRLPLRLRGASPELSATSRTSVC